MKVRKTRMEAEALKCAYANCGEELKAGIHSESADGRVFCGFACNFLDSLDTGRSAYDERGVILRYRK